ncbi:uncharacterized protein C5orf34 homolog [Osmerus mordax]|uniref:uncharacterized protein C5orf34 homolog n=1 Tax=Osmerus mordax TaxID=8014 RepID=UPI00350FC8E4
MAALPGVSLMIMYEDESVDVRYVDYSRLHLAPCGSEFVLEKPPEPTAHPLQSGEKVRQRTRFAISNYKGLLLQALKFRNKYATQPYLPEELLPELDKERFFSVDPEVEWPTPQSSGAVQGPGGETRVSSVEGRACLILGASGEEFSVEFTCSLSHDRIQEQRGLAGDLEPGSSPGSNSLQGVVRGDQSKPAGMYQSSRVVQHHSCCSVPGEWAYPLGLALAHWASCGAGAGVEGGQGTMEVPNPPSEKGRRSTLPQALPLRCPSPHLHRWKLKNSLGLTEQDPEQDLPTDLLKVVWCQGVVFRIMDEAIPVIEISPGDGSVIRSNGALASYFTHHRPEAGAGTVNMEVRQITYHLKSLPPEKPRQSYSVASVVSRASRILKCYAQTRHSLKLNAIPSCLRKLESSFPMSVCGGQTGLSSDHDHIQAAERSQHGPSFVAAELEKIKRFNFLLDNSELPLPAQRASLGRATGLTELHAPGAPTIAQTQSSTDLQDTGGTSITQSSIAEALQRTSRAIQDIDRLLSAPSVTH